MPRPRHSLKGRQCAEEVDRVGLRLVLRRAQAAAGDIVLLFAEESGALTHPCPARAWARRGADLRVQAPWPGPEGRDDGRSTGATNG
ncbi:MAG: hypothetical protein INF93_06435 [Rhodobacter sp.]|nr:hypothetical protein [Rhodobacter sp.]